MMKFEGVMPALVTPLNADETLNVPVLHKLLDDLLEKGADGFYIGGATGEGIALRQEVREHLAEEAVKHVNHRKPCIIHIASTDFSEAIALAKHAEKCGADGVSAIPPIFFGYDENEVYDYYKALAEASNLPMMIYYNPAAKFTVNADFAARAFGIENVTAIKWTSSDYYGMLMLKDLTNGGMNIINGKDEMLLMGLSAGADGGIGTTYNFQIENIKKVYELFKTGDMAAAQEAQIKADRIIRALLRNKTIPATKAVLEMMGYNVGNAVFPNKRYNDADKQRIFNELKAAGL